MTLKELARLADVSPSTVSRVINKNDPSACGPALRDRLWELARETGYLPNSSAQSLKAGAVVQARRPGIVCIFARTPDGRADPFFSQLFRAVEHECLKAGYQIMGIFSAAELARLPAVLEDADGVIVLGRLERTLLPPLLARRQNLVCASLNAIDAPCDQVLCDGYETARMAVRHLHALGHRAIGYIGEKESEARYSGYFDTLQELRLPLRRQYVQEAKQTMRGGYEGALHMLSAMPSSGEAVSTMPTAVFCANDLTAIGAMKAFAAHNLRVPQDLSIVSVDNTEACQFTSPMLTSVDIPKEELGKFAVKLLSDRIAGGHRLPVRLALPCTLISRESCARAHL